MINVFITSKLCYWSLCLLKESHYTTKKNIFFYIKYLSHHEKSKIKFVLLCLCILVFCIICKWIVLSDSISWCDRYLRQLYFCIYNLNKNSVTISFLTIFLQKHILCALTTKAIVEHLFACTNFHLLFCTNVVEKVKRSKQFADKPYEALNNFKQTRLWFIQHFAICSLIYIINKCFILH